MHTYIVVEVILNRAEYGSHDHVDHAGHVDLHIVAWHVNQRGSPTLCAPKSSWRRPG